MSKRIKEKTKELASREIALKKKLLGDSGSLKSKANKTGKIILIGGVSVFILYAVYKSFFQSDEKSRKVRKKNSISGIVTEKLMGFLLPYLSEFLDTFLGKRNKNKTEESEKED